MTGWLYRDWATMKAHDPLHQSSIHVDWITLHDKPELGDFVDFLRQELDRFGPDAAEVNRDFFQRAVKLKLAYFDAAYAQGG